MCGDSTSRADMRRLMGEDLADMIWTDPPYNVDYSGKAGKIKNDKMSAADFDQFLLAVHRASLASSWPHALSGASKALYWAVATTISSMNRSSTAGVPGLRIAGTATASRRRSTNPASTR